MLTPVDIERVERDLEEIPVAIRCIDVWWRSAMESGDSWDAWQDIWLVLFGASLADSREHRDYYETLMSLARAHQSADARAKLGGTA